MMGVVAGVGIIVRIIKVKVKVHHEFERCLHFAFFAQY
jgi:hypothetical protein